MKTIEQKYIVLCGPKTIDGKTVYTGIVAERNGRLGRPQRCAGKCRPHPPEGRGIVPESAKEVADARRAFA